MPVKIRLQRHGKKGKPFYWVVAADARAKRDGRYLEKLGTYNPNTNPATVDINEDNAVNWLEKGAQPTDTARTLMSYKGIMLRHHLNGGVRKGALTQEEADKKLAAWLEEKDAKIQAKKEGLTKEEADAKAKRLATEKAVSDKRLADAAAAEADAAIAEEAAAAEEAAPVEAAAAEETAPVEAVKTEETAPVEAAAAEEAAPFEAVKTEETAPVKAVKAAPEASKEEPKEGKK
jgi:small subunit ribosomal protein S16|tara:strand:+ start:174 stop:872 length:699 start_codon:yes stop_codon:yes gene_type:complete